MSLIYSYESEDLVEYCEAVSMLRTRYAWGGLMRKNTETYRTQLNKMYPSQNTSDRVKTLSGAGSDTYLVDCVGYIKSFYFGGIGSPSYDAKFDYNVEMMYKASSETGDITSIPEIPGLGLYMAGHVGVYAGNGYVWEATLSGFGDGVTKTKLSDRKWLKWFKIPNITYGENDNNSKYYVKVGFNSKQEAMDFVDSITIEED